MDQPRPGAVVHLELHTGDGARACAFYARLCGWRPERVETRCGSYLALAARGGVGAGIVESEARRALWLPYVEVAEIGAATAGAHELGAKVVLPPREGPAGWRSVVVAPDGGPVALWQSKR
jgi:uncharacterized protein